MGSVSQTTTSRPAPSSDDQGRTRSGPRRQALLLGLTLAVGLGLGLGAAALLTDDGPSTAPSVQSLDLPAGGGPVGTGSDAAGGTAQAAPAPPEPGDAVPVAEATSPEAAVRGFLTAEALGDFEASYAFLNAADRRTRWTSPAAWTAAHAQLPPVTGFEVEEVSDGTVTTVTALDSRLDPVLGLVPARARGTWRAVEEEGGWRVAFSESVLQPLYPSDEGAADAARTWVASRQADCGTQGQADAPLLGNRGLADALCEAEGEAALGPAGVLPDGPSTTPLLDAYGPEVFTWARVVPLTAPVAADIVVAPVDDTWQVIGVLGPALP